MSENKKTGVESAELTPDQVIKVLQDKNAELETKLAAANDEINRLGTEAAVAAEEIAKLSAELDGAQQDASQGIVSVSFDGKKYKVIGKKFQFKGRDFTVENLKEDPELLKKLLDIKVGFLVEVKEGE